MDRYDPNEWTKEFVVGNKPFCIRTIKDTNNKIINFLKQGEHKAAVAGLDRVLNGLITMINAGYDYRSHVCFFSWMEANILLFGNFDDSPEQNRIKTAKEALLDARDFAKSDTAKNSISAIIDDINKGYGLSVLSNKYAVDFPNSEIETLAGLNEKLDISSAPAAPVNAAGSVNAVRQKRKPWWLVIAIIIIALIAIHQLLTPAKVMESPELADPVQTTEATTQTTTTVTTTETTTDASQIVGSWEYSEIAEGTRNPDGEKLPDIRNEVYYSFYENGRYSVGDACYEEASQDSQSYAEEKDGRYWICIGGGGQAGSYTISGNQITLVTDESVQYGPSTTLSVTFTLDGDTLVLENDYGTRAYKRTDAAPNEY